MTYKNNQIVFKIKDGTAYPRIVLTKGNGHYQTLDYHGYVCISGDVVLMDKHYVKTKMFWTGKLPDHKDHDRPAELLYGVKDYDQKKRLLRRAPKLN